MNNSEGLNTSPLYKMHHSMEYHAKYLLKIIYLILVRESLFVPTTIRHLAGIQKV